MIRLLATADLHLGRSSTQLPEHAGALPVLKVWNLLVDKAINLKVDAVLLSGDIIDHENSFFETIGQLRSGFKALGEAKIPVFMVAGNHDFKALPDALNDELSQHVFLLGRGGKWQVTTFSKNGTTVQLAGWSFPDRHHRRDPLQDFNRQSLDPSLPSIGLLHGDVFAPDSVYAPLDAARLQAAGVHFWVLGHIHKPYHNAVPGCAICYPGSPQSLSPKEREAHGVLLLEVKGKNDIQSRTLPLSPVWYDLHTIDLSDVTHDSIRAVVMREIGVYADSEKLKDSPAKHIVLDLEFTGSHARPALIDDNQSDITGHILDERHGRSFSVRKVINRVSPAVSDLGRLAQESSPAGLLADSILALEKNETTPLLQKMEEEWNGVFQRVQSGSAYSRLNSRESYFEEQKQQKHEYLLSTCKRLLGELVNQQHTDSS